MDKLIEKFNGNNNLKTNQMYETAVKHANITKEIDIGFADYVLSLDYRDLYKSTDELFDIYIKSL